MAYVTFTTYKHPRNEYDPVNQKFTVTFVTKEEKEGSHTNYLIKEYAYNKYITVSSYEQIEQQHKFVGYMGYKAVIGDPVIDEDIVSIYKFKSLDAVFAYIYEDLSEFVGGDELYFDISWFNEDSYKAHSATNKSFVELNDFKITLKNYLCMFDNITS